MAVYTKLSDRAIQRHIRPFRIGDIVAARGVEAGTINTVYDLRTTKGHFILRILEDRSPTDARYEEALLLHLHDQNLPVPQMVSAGRRGHIIAITPRQQLSIFEYLPGRELAVFEMKPTHCTQVGTFLAQMHGATKKFRRVRRNRFTPERVLKIAHRCERYAKRSKESLAGDCRELRTELERHSWPESLAAGVIHGDLFIDNVRFDKHRLCGVLDFEMASTGPFVYDLAVALGDWAFLHDEFVFERASALLEGYQTHRPLCSVEQNALYELVLFATARFAITRVADFELRAQPETRLFKDYRHFLNRLRALRSIGREEFKRQVF